MSFKVASTLNCCDGVTLTAGPAGSVTATTDACKILKEIPFIPLKSISYPERSKEPEPTVGLALSPAPTVRDC